MRRFIIIVLLLINISIFAQDKGTLSGNLLLNAQKYLKNDSIGATTKVYQENTAGVDAWLFLNYRYKGYSFTTRYDIFNNSPLLNPQDAFTAHGFGFIQINKKIDNLDITVGSFYDQLGNGILFRAYEQRQLGIDYALQGIKLDYKISEHWKAKAFGGNQKGSLQNRFGYNPQVIMGANIEGNYSLDKNNKFGNITMGAQFLNRTLNKKVVDDLVAEINSYDLANRFIPKYNMYGMGGYFNYEIGAFSWNVEANYKRPEAIRNFKNKLELSNGKVFFSSLSISPKKFKFGKIKNKYVKPHKDAAADIRPQKIQNYGSIGINIQARHIDKFVMRSSPYDNLLSGLISYLPSLTKQNAYRLLARYNAPAQDLGEDGVQFEIDFKPRSGLQFLVNGSYVQSLTSNGDVNNKPVQLYHELYTEMLKKVTEKFYLKLGFQTVYYNQGRYEQEPEYTPLTTLTPFGELLFKLPKHRSIRWEFQYLNTKLDQGSFLNTIVEATLSKHFVFAVGDMINIQPHRYEKMIGVIANRVLHYPNIFSSYTVNSAVFTLAFIQQQAGVNCSGGVCRVEPAFSGLRFTTSVNF